MDTDEITSKIVDVCVNLHKIYGPCLLESVYEKLLVIELEEQGLKVEEQKWLPITHKNVTFEKAYRIDLLVNEKIILEIKSTSTMNPVFFSQLKSYLVLSGFKVGLLINFGMNTMREGLKRIVNDYDKTLVVNDNSVTQK